jgi:hypothetical protein
MPIAINGSGTITGISAGGLPDGVITTDDIAASAITRAKIGYAGAILQVVSTQTGAVATGTTTIPFDDTIPQNTEGNQYMSLAITPTSSSSKLLIAVRAHLGNSATNWVTGAIFQDSTVNALAASSEYLATATGIQIFSFEHYMTAGTTSSTTFAFRAGSGNAGTTTFNGDGGSRRMGGVMASSITIWEIAA